MTRDDAGPPLGDAAAKEAEATHPQTGRRRLILNSPLGRVGTGDPDPEAALLAQLGPDTVMMMGDNPALKTMPEKPRLMDFFRLRFGDITIRHLLTSAKRALED